MLRKSLIGHLATGNQLKQFQIGRLQWVMLVEITYHGDVVSVEQDLVELCHPPSFGGRLVLRHVLQQHVDKVVESQQSSHHFLVVLHDDVDAGADALIHKL